MKLMKRRDFLKTLAVGATVVGMTPITKANARYVPTPHSPPKMREDELESYLRRVRSFNEDYEGDIFLDSEKFKLLESSLIRFKRMQQVVGFGNFYLLSFDEAIKIGRRYVTVGAFSVAELNFLEQIFYERATLYGFYGEKPLKNLTDQIPKREVVKVSGNYLYRGKPLEVYRKLQKQVGDKMILTSGVRSVIKQFLLFLDKAYASGGNLSRASRSLAPPGYSFHGISDFDVGQKGYGLYNFTERFVTTDVFKQLKKMGYLSLRYPRDNMLGVRFEPWHIKVNARS